MGARKKEVMNAKRRKTADTRADLRGRFFPHFLDFGERKGLMLSSFPEAKNSSKINGAADGII